MQLKRWIILWAAGCLAASAGIAQDYIKSTGNWADGEHWKPAGEPAAESLTRIGGAHTVIPATAEVTLDQPGERCDRYIIGQGKTGTLIIQAPGTLTTSGSSLHRIGQTSTGTVTVKGGALHVPNGKQTLGSSTGGRGTLNVSGGEVRFGAGLDFGFDVGDGAAINITGTSATFEVSGAVRAREKSTLKFVLGSGGVTSMRIHGVMTINAAASLTIDTTGYTKGLGPITLVDAGPLVGTFAAGNITVLGNWTGHLSQEERTGLIEFVITGRAFPELKELEAGCQVRFAAIEAQTGTGLKRLEAKLGERLDALETQLKKAGRLDPLLAVRDQRAAFSKLNLDWTASGLDSDSAELQKLGKAAENSLKMLRAEQAEMLRALGVKMIAALDALKKAMVRAERLDEAIQADKALKAYQRWVAGLATSPGEALPSISSHGQFSQE